MSYERSLVVRAQPHIIAGITVDQRAIDKSIELFIHGQVDYEFRTTIVPQLTREDTLAIGNRIRCARSYVLQKCRWPIPDPSLSGCAAPQAHYSPIWIEDVLSHFRNIVHCTTRGFTASLNDGARIETRTPLPPQ